MVPTNSMFNTLNIQKMMRNLLQILVEFQQAISRCKLYTMCAVLSGSSILDYFSALWCF